MRGYRFFQKENFKIEPIFFILDCSNIHFRYFYSEGLNGIMV